MTVLTICDYHQPISYSQKKNCSTNVQCNASMNSTSMAPDEPSASLKKSKLKHQPSDQPSHAHSPRIFQPFRALGYVTNELPFSLQARGKVYFLTTCIGNTFQIYDVCGLSINFDVVKTLCVILYLLYFN